MAIKLLKNLDFSIGEEDFTYIKLETKEFLELLKNTIKRLKIKAIPFIGGSFAKGTMIWSENYDIDFFIRFDKKYKEEELGAMLEKIAKSLKTKYKKLHGSRDYLQIEKSDRLTFEIIPVYRISRPKEAKNTTDLSYFHVNYVKKKLNPNLIREIGITKKFFKAQKVYGAESYIQGFSGYSIECLIIYYKSFEKMIAAFLQTKDKIIIDIEKYYEKDELMIEMNEAKTKNPIVLVDPTWDERNVLAALGQETFDKLKVKIKEFLKKPSKHWFEIKELDIEKIKNEAKNKGNEFAHIYLETNKQPGDIAGTKLKKFSKFLINELSDYFHIIKDEFSYKLGHGADLYLILKSKNQIIEQGPPISMKDHVAAFKKAHKDTFVRNGVIYANIKIDFNAKDFIDKWIKDNSKKITQMDISLAEIKN